MSELDKKIQSLKDRVLKEVLNEIEQKDALLDEMAELLRLADREITTIQLDIAIENVLKKHEKLKAKK